MSRRLKTCTCQVCGAEFQHLQQNSRVRKTCSAECLSRFVSDLRWSNRTGAHTGRPDQRVVDRIMALLEER